MTVPLLFALLLGATPARAIWPFASRSCEQKNRPSPCQPSWDSMDKLNDRLRDVLEENQAIERYEKLERDALKNAEAKPDSLTALDSWRTWSEGLAGRKVERDRRLARLLEDIATEFNLPVDFVESRTIAAGTFSGAAARFQPEIASDPIFVSKRTTSSGKTLAFVVDYTADPTASASMLPNGQVVFRIEAFQRALAENVPPWGIAKLASQVHHEMVHFQEVVGPGVYNREASEKKAYREVVAYQDSVYKLRQEYQDHNTAQYEEFKKLVREDDEARRGWEARRRRGEVSGNWQSGLTAFEPSARQWAAMERQAEGLETPKLEMDHARKRLRARLDRERQDRVAYEARLLEEFRVQFGYYNQSEDQGPSGCAGVTPGMLSPALPCIPKLPVVRPRHTEPPVPGVSVQPAIPAVPARPATPAQAALSHEALLNTMAAKGCSDPWAFTQPELDANWSRLAGMKFDAEVLSLLNLQGCQRELFLRLMQMAADRMPERLTAEIFAQAAAVARAPSSTESFYLEDESPRGGAPVIPTCRYHPWCQKWGR